MTIDGKTAEVILTHTRRKHCVRKAVAVFSFFTLSFAWTRSVHAVCTTNAAVPGTYSTIQAAVNAASGTALSGDYCISVSSGIYAEQVTIANIVNSGFRIVISSAGPSAVVVNPPALSTAAFQIQNASVSIKGISILPSSAVSFGIVASSPSAVVDSVFVGGGANILTAGISVADFSTVVKSSVTGQATFGIKLAGQGSTVSFSTANMNTAGDGLQVVGSSNSVSDSVFLNQNGYGAVLAAGANGNSIIRSTFSNACALCHAIDVNSSYNTLTQLYVYNASWSAAGINNGLFNTIGGSTMTTGSTAGQFSLSIAGGSSNTVTQSILSNGLDMNSSANSNQITWNQISAGLSTSYAASLNLTSNNSFSQNIFSGGNPMYLCCGANSNTVSQSTITTSVAATPGVYLLNVASNTITASYVQGAPAVQIAGSTNTTVNSSRIVGLNGNHGLQIINGSQGLSMSSNTILSPANGVYIGPFTVGNVVLTSNSITGSPIGLNFDIQAASATYNISDLRLSGLAPGATAVNFGGNTFVSTLTSVNFADPGIAVNVNGSALAGSSNITMALSTGPRSGFCYSDDPLMVVHWPGNTNCPVTGTISSAPFTAVTAGGLTANWTSTFPGGTNFYVFVSSVANFTASTFSFVTTANSVTFTGLNSGTTYFAEVSTSNVLASATSYFTQLGSTMTLTVTLPTSAITAPTSSYLSTLGTIQGTASAFGAASISSVGVSVQNLASALYWNGGSFASGSPIFSTAAFVGGSSGTWTYSNAGLTGALISGTSYQIHSRAVDSSAQGQSPLATVNFTFDNAPPISTVTVPANGVTLSSFPIITGTAADGGSLASGVSQVQISISSSPYYNSYWNGAAWVAGAPVFLTVVGTTTWSYATVPSGGNLIVGATYQIVSRAQDVAGNVQALLSTSTFVYIPSGGGVITPLGFTSISSNSFVANWSSTFAGGTTFYAFISPASNFTSTSGFVTTTGLSVTFVGLSSSTLYYAEVSTTNASAASLAQFTSLNSTMTLAGSGAGTITALAYTAVSSVSLTANWSSTFGVGTTYYVYISTWGGFTGSTMSITTFNTFATFSGLNPSTQYYAEVSTTNASPTTSSQFTPLNFTTTLGAVGGFTLQSFTNVSSTSATANWGSTFAGGTTFYAYISLAFNFTSTAGYVTTTSNSAQFSGLNPATLYYAEVSTTNAPASATVQFFSLNSTTTLNGGGGGGTITLQAFTGVSSNSLQANWNTTFSAGTTYYAVISNISNFTGTISSVTTTNNFALFNGLVSGTQYWIEVSTSNTAPTNMAAYTQLGSTMTLSGGGMITAQPYTGITANSLTANWTSTFAGGTTYYAVLSLAPLPNGSTSNLFVSGTALFATFNGLMPATVYYGGVSTSPTPGSGTGLGPITTGSGGGGGFFTPEPFTGVTPNSLTANWTSTFAPGTTFYAFISTSSNFLSQPFMVTTTTNSAFFGGLNPATLYFAEVSTSNVPPGNIFQFAPLGSTVTPNGAGFGLSVTFTGVGNIISSPGGINCGNGGSTCFVNFAPNSVVTLTEAPGAGYSFNGWTGACSTTSTVCTVTMNAALNVNADFTSTGTVFPLSPTFGGSGIGNITSAPAGLNCGNGGTTCTINFSSGTAVTLTASPGLGSTFGGWNGISGCGAALSCSFVLSGPMYPTAIFNSQSGGFNLIVSTGGTGVGNVVSAPAGINCGNGGFACISPFASSTTVGLTAGPGANSTFSGWGGACAGTGGCTVLMNSTQVVSAVFNASGGGMFTLTVSSGGSGGGNVTSTPAGINCGGPGGFTCSSAFPTATIVTLTATPSTTSVFGGWIGAGCGSSTGCSITMNQANFVAVTFNPSGNSYPLSVSFSGGGMGNVMSSPAGINCGNGGITCSAQYAANTSVLLTAAPSAGATFTGWAGAAGCGAATTCTVTVNAAQNVTASFASSGFTLTVSNGGIGAGNITSTPAGINCGNGFTSCSAIFPSSTTVTLTATAGGGSTFGGWNGAGCAGTGSCTVILNGSLNIGAFFNSLSYSLTISTVGSGVGNVTSSPAGINCGNGGFGCSVSFSSNTAVTLTASSAAGSVFSGWSGGGCAGTSPTCVVTVSASQFVTAFFDPSTGGGFGLQVGITGAGVGNVVSAPAGINCGNGGTTCFMNFPSATIVSLTASPLPGYVFAGWSGACTGLGACSVTMNAAQNVTATFYATTLTLTVASTGTGFGNIASNPSGINCGNGGTFCSISFSSNTLVTLSATPGGGSLFGGWNGAGCTGTASCVVTMNLSQFVTAAFYTQTAGSGFTLTVNNSGNGNIISNPAGINCGNGGTTCTANFATATPVTLTAAAGSGATFAGWGGGGCTGNGSCTVTMSVNQYISATFNTAYVLTVNSSGSGIGNVVSAPAGINYGNGQTASTASFTANTIVMLTAGAAAGSVFAGWSGGGCSGTGSCSVTMSAAQNVTATFNPITAGAGFALTVTSTGTGVGNVASSPVGIDCGTNCTAIFPSASVVTLSANVGANSSFGGWTGGCSGIGTCTVTMNAAQNVNAIFNPAGGGNSLTVTTGGTGIGSVISNPAGINCGNGGFNCAVAFSSGTLVTLTAMPGPNSFFTGWNVPGCSGTASCTVSMSAAQNVMANFTGVVTVSGSIAYTGSQFGPVRVEFWSDAGFSVQLISVQTLPGGAAPYAYSVSVPGGGYFFVRAYMDVNNNLAHDANEPLGFYAPHNQGPEPVATPVSGNVGNINFTMTDPGAGTGGVSGEGTASLSVSSVPAGSMFNLGVTYQSLTAGIQIGGKIGVILPPGFYGAPSLVTSTAAATFSAPMFNGPAVFVSVLTGSVAAGQNVTLTFNNLFAPCASSTQTFTVASAQNGSVLPQPLFSGSPTLNIAAGSASMFQFANPSFSMKQNVLSDPQTIVARDFCGNVAPIGGSPQTLALRGKVYNFSGGFADDPTVGFNTAASVPSLGSANVTFAVGQSSQAVYVYSTSTGMKNIEMFSTLSGPATFYSAITVLNGNPLTGVSVSTVAFGTGQTVATIIANGDPTAANQAFINFNLADPTQSWHVLVSSAPLAAGVTPTGVWERWGYGQPGLGMISWDGRYLPWINGGTRVPTGTYYVRVEVGGVGGVHDDSLSIVVNTPQLAGQVLDYNSNPHLPLGSANITLYGPFGGGSVQSNILGGYVFPGLGAGSYNLLLTRDSYLDSSVSFSLDSAGKVSTFTALTSSVFVSSNSSGGLDFLITRAPILLVVPTAGVGFSTATADRWGSLQLTGTKGQAPVFGALHVAAGTNTFDDGGQWNPGAQTFLYSTFLKFKVSVDTYTVLAMFPGYSNAVGTVFVGPNGSSVTLPAFANKSTLSGLVSVPANPAGIFVSVNAIAASSVAAGGGFTGVYLNPGSTSGVYTITNLDPGNYVLTANAPGYTAVSAGSVVVPAASVVAQNLPTFAAGSSITGAAKINTVTTGESLQLSVNAWAPGAYSFGSTVVYSAGGASGLTIPYQITGLLAGTTYQIYAQLTGAGSLNVLEGMPLSGTAPSAVNFTYAPSSGAIVGTINLPSGSGDFGQVDMYGQVVASARPERVGVAFSVIGSTNLPGFACTANGLGAPSGNCPAGNNSATFQITGLDTETDDITFFYHTTGQSSKIRASVVNGSTSPLTANLAAQTYSISGSINNQITNSLFNTNANLFANAPDISLIDSFGNPAAISPVGVPRSTASLARVIAVRQDINSYNVAVSTVFNPSTSFVGFLTAAGTYTITNVPSGVYVVRTANLTACATCPTAVPAVTQIVSVIGANQTGVNFTLSDGFSISGAISLDGGVQDADVLNVSVLNRRQEIVRSTTVYLGDVNLGLFANSISYSFSNIPANDFYTLTVVSQLSQPKYTGQPIKFPDPSLSPNGLQAGLTGQNVVMKRASYIIGRLRDSNTGALINPNNATLLAPNFAVTATADPWVPGGFAVAASSTAGRPIQGDGYFRVGPLLPQISYNLSLAQASWDPAFLAQGSQNYAPVTIAGIIPQPGELHDVGVISLSQGQSISGTVKQSTTTGIALGNIKITAKPSFGDTTLTIQTFTNQQGKYTVWVSSAVSNEYDITAAPADGNLSSSGQVYGQLTLRNVDLQATATADFLLTPLMQSVTGQVVVADAASGGVLSYPFGVSKGFPVAAINLQPQGVVPTQNPLGDIQIVTDQSGLFQITGLSTGTYSLKATSLGYSVFNATVTTTATSYRIYTGADIVANRLPNNVLTLQRGAILTGRLLKPDGSAPNASEVSGIAAANFASGEYIVGSVDIDPTAKTVNSYSISGFKTGINYTVVVLPSDKLDGLVFPPEGAAVSFSVSETTSTKNVDLTYTLQNLDCQATSKSVGNSQFQIKIDCTKSLRNTLASDNDLSQIVVVSTVTSLGATLAPPNSTGQLQGSDKAMSLNRRTITSIYRAAANETNFSIRVRAYSAAVDPHTGSNFYVDKIFDFYTGLISHVSQSVSNIQGGSVELVPTSSDEASGVSERAEIDLQAGTFAEGIDDASAVVVASKTITLGISKGQDQTLAKTLALATKGYVPAGLEILANPDAFPPEMAAAMKMYRGLASSNTVGGINPLSSFYSVFLPAGIRHLLKKQADLTLSYTLLTNGSQNPDNINIWYYNPAIGKYVSETTNRRLDTVNKTITVSVDHFSTFVVLGSTPVFTSTGVFTGDDISVYNFPNPSDCIPHNYQSGGVLPANALATWQGTMIRFSLPGSDFSDAQIKIYNMAGELVRSMDQGQLQGGAAYYNNWDCKNDSGRTVASGVYIGQVKWDGKSKFFKMAIIKGSGL